MAGRVCVALLLGLNFAACSWAVPGAGIARATPQPSATGGLFAAVSGVPMKLRRLQPGQSCPLSKVSQTDPQFGIGLGTGPVYVLDGQTIRSDPEHPQKVAWIADPSYSGPIRIRGGRIDGSGQLLLGGPDNHWRGAPIKTVETTDLYPELDFLETHSIFSNPPSPWRVWPSMTYIATPGCYAWQIDGLGFTELITIQALQVPTLPPGAACPVSPQQVAHNLSAEFGSGQAVGTVPIYVLMGEMQGGALRYSQSYSQSHYKDGWAYSKVLWMAKPEVSGRVLIRGRQIDGPNAIGFGMGDDPEFALQWAVGSQSGWASLPSETRIRAPGCYAYQVDSQKGSEVIVFQVVETP
jgi:hypothetical protein